MTERGEPTPLTAGHLIEHLSAVPPDTPVIARYDCEGAYGPVTLIRMEPVEDIYSVALIVE